MIFLDETGKRWKYIKLGSGLISSSVLIPLGVIGIAAAFYVPTWGGLSLPKPFVSPAKNSSQPQVLGSSTSTLQAKPKSKVTATTATKTSQTVPNATSTSAIPVSQATTPATSTTTSPSQPVTTTPAPTQTTGQGTSDKPANPSNKDYGISHQPPTRL